MATVHLYSDVSVRCGHTGACVIAVLFTPEREVQSHLLDLTEYSDSVVAELAATLWAVKRYQTADRVIAYTDLNWLPAAVHDGRVLSYAQKTQALLDELQKLASSHPHLAVKPVDRKNPDYQRCHLRSRRKAKTLSQSSGAWHTRSVMDLGQAQPRQAGSWTNYL